MQVVADICVLPLGKETSVSQCVRACQQVIEEAGLTHKVHAYGTNIEGDWDDVMAAARRCHEVLHEMGIPRISTSIKVGTRTDKAQSIQQKIDAVT
jgi:uncharacterized protein (TIGR00106 family)